jgi:DNA-binding response OmpR family regulator
VRLDLLGHRAFVGTRDVQLTVTEFRLLELLLRQPDRAFTRAELSFLAPRSHNLHSIGQHIKTLRRELGCPGLIETVRGFGYRLAERTAAGLGHDPAP